MCRYHVSGCIRQWFHFLHFRPKSWAVLIQLAMADIIVLYGDVGASIKWCKQRGLLVRKFSPLARKGYDIPKIVITNQRIAFNI